MKLLGQCQGSKENHKYKYQLFIRRRHYKIPAVNDRVLSKSLLCGTCYRGIKRLIK